MWVSGGIGSARLVGVHHPQGLFQPKGFHDSGIQMENMFHVKPFREYLVRSQLSERWEGKFLSQGEQGNKVPALPRALLFGLKVFEVTRRSPKGHGKSGRRGKNGNCA